MVEITPEVTEYHNKITHEFLNGAIEVCKENDLPTNQLIELLFAQTQMCQTMLFCFMASHIKDEHVAGFYGEIRNMSLVSLERLIDRPDILLEYSERFPGGNTPSLLAVIELFKELKDSEC